MTGKAGFQTEGGIEIRPVGTAELPQLLAVYRRCEDFLALGPDPHASEAMVLKDLQLSQEQGGAFCGLYRPDGALVGVLDTIPAGFEGDPSRAYLALLMIAAPHRRQGLGAQVVRALEAHLREDQRLKSIAAGVQVNNPQALRFWQRMGFAVVSEPERLPDGTVCYRLLKNFRE